MSRVNGRRCNTARKCQKNQKNLRISSEMCEDFRWENLKLELVESPTPRWQHTGRYSRIKMFNLYLSQWNGNEKCWEMIKYYLEMN